MHNAPVSRKMVKLVQQRCFDTRIHEIRVGTDAGIVPIISPMILRGPFQIFCYFHRTHKEEQKM
ncbi:hypothetical protein KP509_1Z013600 [Ceratopteris richardii]|nr:hypothetical protein KP509_1Z013600 [Ceratopteris richardii]